MTNMAASCSIVCCGEEKDSDKAVIVDFSNGSVLNDGNLDFTLYKNTDEANPRKKHRRIVVAETNRLSYVGQNFGAGALKCNNLCTYYVGVLNKQTMEMEVHNAQFFNMLPVIPGEAAETANSNQANQTFREKIDSLIEAFGTNKQKRALSSRRLNRVADEALHVAVAEAARNVIEQKGVDALQQEVVENDSQSELALHLPPCNMNADKPEDVYPFKELLTPVDLKALEEAGEKMAALTPVELRKMKDEGRCLCLMQYLERLPIDGENRKKIACCAFYLSLLLQLARQKTINRQFGMEEGCPRIIQTKLFKTFTVQMFCNGRVQNMISSTMRVKIAAYILALLLHMGRMTADISLLHRDLGITEARVIEVAKSMGLTLDKTTRRKSPEDGPEHRHVSLVLPLVKYDQLIERRKRKKMH